VAEDLALPDLASERRAEPEALVTRRPPDTPGVFRGRFALAYLLLAVLAGGALGTTILLVDRPESSSAPWSSWKPFGSRATFDDQIAEYVGARYLLPSGNPLVAIVPGRPTVTSGGQEIAVTNVVIQDDPNGDEEGFRVVEIDRSTMYQLCGSGPQCSIGEGAPTPERLQVLQREALELALYTFKYGDDVDTVIALLPPNLGEEENAEDDTSAALFFEKSALADALAQPLQRTLVSPTPPTGTELNPVESLVVDRLTADRLFLYQFQPLQAGSALMHLLRPSSVQ
jgi:hypothetical protein